MNDDFPTTIAGLKVHPVAVVDTERLSAKIAELEQLLSKAEQALETYADQGEIKTLLKHLKARVDPDHKEWVLDEFCEPARKALRAIQDYMAFRR